MPKGTEGIEMAIFWSVVNLIGGLLLFFVGTPISVLFAVEFMGRYGQSHDPLLFVGAAMCSYVAVDCFFCSPASTLRALMEIKQARRADK